jgi:hypothetical protein
MIESEFESILFVITDESVRSTECVDVTNLDLAALGLCTKHSRSADESGHSEASDHSSSHMLLFNLLP